MVQGSKRGRASVYEWSWQLAVRKRAGAVSYVTASHQKLGKPQRSQPCHVPATAELHTSQATTTPRLGTPLGIDVSQGWSTSHSLPMRDQHLAPLNCYWFHACRVPGGRVARFTACLRHFVLRSYVQRDWLQRMINKTGV